MSKRCKLLVMLIIAFSALVTLTGCTIAEKAIGETILLYVLLDIPVGIIFGVATNKILENKGYSDNWFWFGFFCLGVALIVAACKPECKTTYSTPSFMKSQNGPTGNGWKCSCGIYNPSYMTTCECGKNKPTEGSHSNNEWKCACGTWNPNFIGTCSCGVKKYQAANELKRRQEEAKEAIRQKQKGLSQKTESESTQVSTSEDRCPECNSPLLEGSTYCNKCGAKLEEQKHSIDEQELICPKCSSVLAKGSAFCNKCGFDLSHQEESHIQSYDPLVKPRCPKCNALLRADATQCGRCGATFSQPVFSEAKLSKNQSKQPKCGKCGAILKTGATHCNRCGALIDRKKTHQVSSTSTNSNESSCELYKHSKIIIDQMVRGLRADDRYNIYSIDGKRIGYISQGGISGGAVAAQVMLGRGMKHFASSTFSVYNERNKVIGGISQNGFSLELRDQNNSSLGTMRNGNLIDRNGKVAAVFKFSGLNKYDVYDASRKHIASIDKKWNGVAKELFTKADKYMIEFESKISEQDKCIAILLCISIDFFH